MPAVGEPQIVTDDAKLDELRGLLLRPEREQLDELDQRLRDDALRTDDVARVLAEAILLRAQEDEALSRALIPVVLDALKIAVRDEPEGVAEILHPVMGPSIRKSIAQALASMTQSLNRTLSNSLSPRGIRWRIEAWRTGKSFAEVALLHSLVYRVEQVYLIHGETGLMLHHLVAPDVEAQDADTISAMLTAISDFVHDSFGARAGQALETMQVGELTVWVERGPLAAVACVIRGSAPEELRETLTDVTARVHGRMRTPLERFDGNAAPFALASPLLEECLDARYVDS